MVAPGTGGLQALREAFGDGILGPEGSLDRKKLAFIVFSDDTARRTLNAITHPRISKLAAERASALAATGEPLGCYEAALLVENGITDRFRPLVVVACPEEEQLARIRSRDGASQRDALARIRAQRPLAEKVAVADFVVDTTGPVEQTRLRVDDVLRAICARVMVDPARYFGLGLR